MTENEGHEIDFDLICENFPRHVSRIKMLVRCNASFAAICDDYCLACKNLRWFETGPDDRWKNEIADYRAVISELADELMRVLQTDEIAAGKSSTGGDR